MPKTIGVFNPSKYPLDSDYGSPFKDHGSVTEFSNPFEGKKFDLVVFPGGPDVDPRFYGEKPHPKTIFDLDRTTSLLLAFEVFKLLNTPMVGICGGMQILAVANRCKLNQHITGHKAEHQIIINETSDVIRVSSDHHQALIIDNVKYGLILAEDNYSDTVEAIWFPKTKSLGVQYHPEWMERDSDGYKYFQHLLETYVL